MSNENNEPPRRTGSPWVLPSNTGPRIGRVGAWGSTPSSGGNSSSGGRRIATLSDMSSGGPSMGGGPPGPPMGHAHDDDDEDDEDDRGRGEDWYAGGERSGISIQNPDRPGAVPGGDRVRELLRRAAEAGPPPSTMGDPAPTSRTFFGGGHTLGSDEVESTFIPDPTAQDAQPEEETAIRHLTLWRNGFSVEDGELMNHENPAHRQILDEILAGRAPPQIMNVGIDQPVELRIVKRLQQDYIPPVRKVFSGQGHRLGSPAPGPSSSSAEPANIPGSFPTGDAGGSSLPTQRSAENFGTRFEVDQTKPTTSVQIRLADGTRMVARMNLTHTVGDIRNFINASRPENLAREYLMMTTFPNKTLEDDSQTIEAAGLANSVVVQRWA